LLQIGQLLARLLASVCPIYLSTSNFDQKDQLLKRLKIQDIR